MITRPRPTSMRRVCVRATRKPRSTRLELGSISSRSRSGTIHHGLWISRPTAGCRLALSLESVIYPYTHRESFPHAFLRPKMCTSIVGGAFLTGRTLSASAVSLNERCVCGDVRATFAEPHLYLVQPLRRVLAVASQFITHPYFGDLGLDVICTA